MAQESSNNNNNNVSIPDQISWTKNEKEKEVYRGTMIQSTLQSNNFGIARSFGKNAASSEAISISSQISGGAIDISFNDPGTGIKSSYPSIQPIGNKFEKPQAPLLEVVGDTNINNINDKILNNDKIPQYDNIQPQYAHHSQSLDPIKMKETLIQILSELEQNGDVDYYEKSPFVFAGRAYGTYDYCEFLLNIFSDESSDSVVEIRRSCGESFQFANIESNLLKQLTKQGAIDNEDDDDEDDLSSFDFGFGFDSLPSLDTMTLDSNFTETDIDDDNNDDFKTGYDDTFDANQANELLQSAVNTESMRDVLRSDIIYLNQQMAKNEDIFKNIPDIISTINNAITDQLYDCW
eukprot:CAMPEP_0201564642 /NCGR_PEP_ID=MMETSP0190_2-20130828/3129_1 /ASSEMBLY_ACC=CAM_ASM_000263 /TAXON_ID=37353 /ORGANISM="Rosalina sp." /LENGTH=349 /DNA_ID=CAMNT_0047981103 /DNA_START=143 /DNA_END=1189 /DNA_ORIENTATION=+